MQRWTFLGFAALVAGMVACGSDSSAPIAGPGSSTRGPGGTDSSGSGPGSPTSTAPVASLTITPHALVLPLGSYGVLTAVARDAAGIRVVKQASWRAADPNVAALRDSGLVLGKALGTTKVYATVDGFTDSATVMVIPVSPTTDGPPAVAEFNLKLIAIGPIPGTDTTRSERVAGVAVTLKRTGGIKGDTLTAPEDAGSGVTDANGEAKFNKLKAGTYAIVLTPPAGSPYARTETGIVSSNLAEFTAVVALQRRP